MTSSTRSSTEEGLVLLELGQLALQLAPQFLQDVRRALGAPELPVAVLHGANIERPDRRAPGARDFSNQIVKLARLTVEIDLDGGEPPLGLGDLPRFLGEVSLVGGTLIRVGCTHHVSFLSIAFVRRRRRFREQFKDRIARGKGLRGQGALFGRGAQHRQLERARRVLHLGSPDRDGDHPVAIGPEWLYRLAPASIQQLARGEHASRGVPLRVVHTASRV
jgi:hypothetical protein